MAFARTTAVAGAGTVACSSTTTVTGTGTAFAFGLGGAPGTNQARVGGTITVGGVTRTIVAIASATSLTVDSAFGTFTGQAFTVQTGITQTGTDTLDNASATPTGFILREDRGSLFRTFDVQGQDLEIQGTLTVRSWGAQLRNDGSCSNRFTVSGSASGGEIIFTGRKSAANNGPLPYPGFDWLGQNGQKVMRLASTNASFPAKFTVIDACVRFGSDWLTTDSGHFSRITTQGDLCWILCIRGTGTSQARIRQDNTTASVDFQAAKTYVGMWLNFGVPQVSLKGYVPIDTDGPEINLASVAVASRVTIEDYLTTYVVSNYYAGAQIVLLGSAWTRLKNNLLGTNIVWRSSSAVGGRFNVLEFSKQITIRAQDTAGTLLSDGYMYYQPVGANVAGVRAKGIASDITFDLSQQAIPTVGGTATSEFVYAWDWASSNANESTYAYFCTGTTKGSETHVIRSTRYGYDKQSVTVTLAGNGAATPTYVHTSLPTTDKVIANAAAITGLTFNFGTKVINVTGTLTVQQIYDAYQYQLNQTANLQQPDECVVSNGRTDYVGWTITNSGTINPGTSLTILKANTITNTGTITAIYQSSAGTSTTLELRGVAAGSSIYIGNESTGVTTLFQSDVAAGTYRAYFAPGVTAPQLIARELYGYQRESEVIPLTGGLIWYQFVDVPDVGIVQPTLATVQAYTSIENADKFYDRTAAFRLTEQGIKLGQITTRNGTTIDVSAPYSVVIDQSAASVYGISGDTITLKATGYANGSVYTNTVLIPPATLEADTNEVLSADFEDANGDSAVTILGGDGAFELWKVTTATPTANYTSGTKLADVGNEKYRFTGLSGYDIVGVDINSNVRRRTSMVKGIYTQSFYVGDQIQLAQAPQVIDNGLKLDLLAVEIEALQTNSLTLPEIEASTILAKEVTVRQAKRKAALAAALSA